MVSFLLRKNTPSDLPKLRALFAGCRRTIGALGIDQWQDGYPQDEILLDDMNQGISYGLWNDKDEILASFTFFAEGDPAYDACGARFWKSDRRYAAVHRVAVDADRRRMGLGSAVMDSASRLARQHGLFELRIDTHHGNLPMRSLLSHYGFVSCGDLYLPGNLFRIGYRFDIKNQPHTI